jgi:predicted amidohydrolase YtcJ
MAVADDKLDELLVDMTIVGGKVMYQRSGGK